MTEAHIAAYRLHNQQLIGSRHKTPGSLVEYMGAIQAQDYNMAKWAIGTRIPGADDEAIEKAIDKGQIIRTHVLRPTWHFAAARDIRWMLSLTAPHINTAASHMYKKMELDAPVFSKSHRLIEKALRGGKQLTREELMQVLKRSGINTDELRSTHLMFRAELDGLVCNGSRRGRQFTYALMDERVPATKALTRDEALAKLALKYFTSHGPATLPDFCWWSGLPVKDARKGLEHVKPGLMSETINGHEYWFLSNIKTPAQRKDTVHFLPAFDEYMISYKNRSASLDPALAKQAISVNGIFKPIIVVNGLVEGTWKRSVEKSKLIIEPQFFTPKTKLKKNAMEEAIRPFAHFLGLSAEIV